MRSGLVAVGLALFLACTGRGEPPGDCLDDGDCEGLAICTEAFTCQAVQCLDSSQCGFGNFCQFNTCFQGCGEDADCQSGHFCNVERNECALSACTSTAVDCSFGEVCDVGLGECVFPNDLCSTCNGPGFAECESRGGSCRYDGDWFCHTPCTVGDEAPRGFECRDDAFSDPGFYWYGNCYDALFGDP